MLFLTARHDPPQLNFSFQPVTFTATTFDGGKVVYTSAEQLSELRAKLASSHVVTHLWDSIRYIPTIEGTDLYAPTTHHIQEHKTLTMRLAD